MAGGGGRGYRGDKREGFGAGRAGRGAGRFDRGRNKFSWKRNDGETDHSCSNTVQSAGAADRWDAAAAATAGRQDPKPGEVWVEKSRAPPGSGEGTVNSNMRSPSDAPPRRLPGIQPPPQVNPTMNPVPCPICKSLEHTPVRCPQAFCERCSKLGHLASVCIEFLPWECIAPMCAFSARGQGFYYIHDSCTARQLKERETSVIVTIVEGHTSTRDMKFDLTQYIATGWRCTARAIGPGVYIVRFPNRRDVSKACYIGRMTLKSTGTVVKIDPWTSALGAKGIMEKAWIKVGNVPLEKRNERNLAYVSSLVGVPLEIDGATLHRPESVRVKIGCRNVDEIPPVAEAVLGDHFFDFFYELDQVLVRDPERGKNLVKNPSDPGAPLLKKMKVQNIIDTNEVGTSSAMGEMMGSVQGKQHAPAHESPEDEGSEESFDNTLLIDSLAREHDEAEKKKKDWALSCGKSNVTNNGAGVSTTRTSTTYLVQSPETSMDEEAEVIPTPPLVTKENLCFSLRNAQTNLMRMDEKAEAMAKKRDLEGLMKGGDREAMERGAKMLRDNASNMMMICAAATDDAATT